MKTLGARLQYAATMYFMGYIAAMPSTGAPPWWYWVAGALIMATLETFHPHKEGRR